MDSGISLALLTPHVIVILEEGHFMFAHREPPSDGDLVCGFCRLTASTFDIIAPLRTTHGEPPCGDLNHVRQRRV